MNQADLIDAVAQESSSTNTQVKSILDALAKVTHEQINSGNDVYMNNIGRLRVMHAKARMGRNPITGEVINIPAKNRVAFVPAQSLKDTANS